MGLRIKLLGTITVGQSYDMEQLRAQGGYEHRPSLYRIRDIELGLNDELAYGYTTNAWRPLPFNLAMAFNPAEVCRGDSGLL